MQYVGLFLQVFVVQPVVWLFRHRGVLLVLVIIVVGLVVYQRACVRSSTSVVDTLAPKVVEAPYVLRTVSRVYYVASLSEIPSGVILYRWYEWNGRAWVLCVSTEGVPFESSRHGPIQLIRR